MVGVRRPTEASNPPKQGSKLVRFVESIINNPISKIDKKAVENNIKIIITKMLGNNLQFI